MKHFPTLLLVFALLSLSLMGCQSYKDAIYKLCNAMELSGANKQAPDMRAMQTAKWIEKNVTNGKAVELSTALGNADMKTRAKIFGNVVKEQGITKCPLLDMYKETIKTLPKKKVAKTIVKTTSNKATTKTPTKKTK